MNSNCSCCPETLNSGQNRRFFAPCDLEIQWMTLKNNRDPLLCYIKLCASFQSHRWIETKVTVRKRSIRVKINDFFVPYDLEIWRMTLNKANLRDLIAVTGQKISIWIQIVNFSARVTVKFDGWPRKTIGHFFHTTTSFVHHFKSIGEFKLDLHPRNAQFGSKLVIYYPVWPWNLMDDLGKQ